MGIPMGIRVMNALITNLDDLMADRNHSELHSLLPIICLSPQFNFEKLVACLLQSYATDLTK